MKNEAEIIAAIKTRKLAIDDSKTRVQSNPTQQAYVQDQQRKQDQWHAEIALLEWVLGID